MGLIREEKAKRERGKGQRKYKGKWVLEGIKSRIERWGYWGNEKGYGRRPHTRKYGLLITFVRAPKCNTRTVLSKVFYN